MEREQQTTEGMSPEEMEAARVASAEGRAAAPTEPTVDGVPAVMRKPAPTVLMATRGERGVERGSLTSMLVERPKSPLRHWKIVLSAVGGAALIMVASRVRDDINNRADVSFADTSRAQEALSNKDGFFGPDDNGMGGFLEEEEETLWGKNNGFSKAAIASKSGKRLPSVPVRKKEPQKDDRGSDTSKPPHISPGDLLDVVIYRPPHSQPELRPQDDIHCCEYAGNSRMFCKVCGSR